MLTPAYKLTLGDRVVDTTDEPKASTVVVLEVALDLETPADSLTVMLGQVGGLRPARGDEVKIELGYADDASLTQVMVGTVVTVEPGLTSTRVVAHSAADKLLRTFVDRTFEGRTAGAIVRDLAGQAGVKVSKADDGITFPAYVVDGRRSVHRHMRELADLSGFDLYVNTDGALVFAEFRGGATAHVLERGTHVLAVDVQRTPPLAGTVEAWGESPTGSQGDDAWAWLIKDFSASRGTAGSGQPLLLLEHPALRTTSAARTAAEAAQTVIARRALRGQVVTVGRPQITLGDAIQLRGMSDEGLNAQFQVRSVTHRITKRGGFTTGVGFRAIRTSGV